VFTDPGHSKPVTTGEVSTDAPLVVAAWRRALASECTCVTHDPGRAIAERPNLEQITATALFSATS